MAGVSALFGGRLGRYGLDQLDRGAVGAGRTRDRRAVGKRTAGVVADGLGPGSAHHAGKFAIGARLPPVPPGRRCVLEIVETDRVGRNPGGVTFADVRFAVHRAALPVRAGRRGHFASGAERRRADPRRGERLRIHQSDRQTGRTPQPVAVGRLTRRTREHFGARNGFGGTGHRLAGASGTIPDGNAAADGRRSGRRSAAEPTRTDGAVRLTGGIASGAATSGERLLATIR